MGIAAGRREGVPLALLVGVSRVRRCAMGIAGGRAAWVALGRGDCWWACRGGRRCGMGIAAGRVAWVVVAGSLGLRWGVIRSHF